MVVGPDFDSNGGSSYFFGVEHHLVESVDQPPRITLNLQILHNPASAIELHNFNFKTISLSYSAKNISLLDFCQVLSTLN